MGEDRRFPLSPTAYFARLALGTRGTLGVMIEAGMVAGYVVAWVVRKARRVAGRLDDEADAVVDVGLDRLHEMVADRLAGHPVMARLLDEAEQAAANDGKVSAATCQLVEQALTTMAREDEAFGHTLVELATRLADARQAAANRVSSHQRTTLFAGNPRTEASRGGIAFGQVAGDVHIAREAGSPPQPGRFGH
jgi:hypothetical protein